MRKLFILILTCILFSSCKKISDIVIYNDLNIPRKNELAEFSLQQLGLEKEIDFIIYDENHKEVPYQILSDGSHVLFPVTIKANDSLTYTIEKGVAAPVKNKAYSRFVPERKDDFAWENDCIAFRMYGPALAPENPSNGVDVWLKRTPKLIVDKFYKDELQNGKSYHVDSGEGLDCYKVGHTLGAGGIAPYIDSTLYVGNYFNSYKILEEGPLRTSFSLTYDSINIGTQIIQQTITITLDAGSQLNRAVVNFEGDMEGMNLATGIYLHDKVGTINYDKSRGYLNYIEDAVSDAGVPSGKTYIGIYIPDSLQNIKIQDKHLIGISHHSPGNYFVYYFGAGWSKWGFKSEKEWIIYMKNKILSIQTPLRVIVK